MKRVPYYISIFIGSLASMQAAQVDTREISCDRSPSVGESLDDVQDGLDFQDLEWDIEPMEQDYRVESVAPSAMQAYYAYMKIKAMQLALRFLVAWDYIQSRFSHIF